MNEDILSQLIQLYDSETASTSQQISSSTDLPPTDLGRIIAPISQF